LLLAIAIIFLLLAANFQSMRLALAIILTIPAVLCGVLFVLCDSAKRRSTFSRSWASLWRFAAAESTLERLKQAAKTPGAIARNELVLAEKQACAARPAWYSTVHWAVRSAEQALFVPKTSVVTTTERTFVIREKDGRAEWVNVQKGPADGDMIRVIGPLNRGDHVLKRATDEIREGAALKSAGS